jgi:hypothetical protein
MAPMGEGKFPDRKAYEFPTFIIGERFKQRT